MKYMLLIYQDEQSWKNLSEAERRRLQKLTGQAAGF
jgi:hypothetical protein